MSDIQTYLKELKQQRGQLKSEYEFKLEKLNEAIVALEKFIGGQQPTQTETKPKFKRGRIAWKSEITSLFETQDKWSITEIFDHLVKQGFELESTSAKGSISTTLVRLEGDGLIEKIGTGTYRKKENDAEDNEGHRSFERQQQSIVGADGID